MSLNDVDEVMLESPGNNPLLGLCQTLIIPFSFLGQNLDSLKKRTDLLHLPVLSQVFMTPAHTNINLEGSNLVIACLVASF